jgi:hypothetical protein
VGCKFSFSISISNESEGAGVTGLTGRRHESSTTHPSGLKTAPSLSYGVMAISTSPPHPPPSPPSLSPSLSSYTPVQFSDCRNLQHRLLPTRRLRLRLEIRRPPTRHECALHRRQVQCARPAEYRGRDEVYDQEDCGGGCGWL